MKKIIKYILPVCALFMFTACEPDYETEGVSRITYFNDIELIGEDNLVVEQGGTYTEPGAKAFEDETDVSDQVVISGNIDVNTVGDYTVSYYIENVDGFGKTITRKVFVLPADRKISDEYDGKYTGTNSTGVYPSAVTITHLGEGLYYCTDLIAARYEKGFEYGSAYRIPGYFYINTAGTEYYGLTTSSPWGEWTVANGTLSGTTFDHFLQFSTVNTPITLTKD